MLHKGVPGMNGAQAGTVFRKAQAARCAVPVGVPGTPWPASLLFRLL